LVGRKVENRKWKEKIEKLNAEFAECAEKRKAAP